MATSSPISTTKLGITAILSLLKAVRKGDASISALQEALKGLSETELKLTADLARVKLDFLVGIRDLKSLF